MTRWGASVRFSCRVVLGPLFLLVGCYGSSSVGEVHHRTPGPGSTETGNPPVIDVTKVALVVQIDEVHVIGKNGAVSPGGSELEVETLSSGHVTHGKSDSKGAFDIRVDGSLDDTYRLLAFGESADVKSTPVFLSRGGATVGEGDGGSPIGGGDGGLATCEQRATAIDEQLTQAADKVDHACDTNVDCTILHAPVDCPAWACSGTAMSHRGTTEVDFGAIRAGACQDFKDADCWRSWPVVDCGSPGPAACVAGRCVDCTSEDCSAASCEPCDTPEITWAPTGQTIGDSHTIVDCKTLVTNFADGSPQCSTTLPCTSSRGGGTWSLAHLQNLLGDYSVKDAFASDKSFGPILPAGTRLTIGAHSISNGDASCASETCSALPGAVQELFALLDRIASEQSCASGSNPGEACDMPFDRGTGSQSISVYTFDGAIGNCVSRPYSGAGGNANRFDTFESCIAACPQTASTDGCASDRVFVPNVCLECMPMPLDCRQIGTCMLRCTDSTDCTDPGFELCTGDGTCTHNGCG